MDPSPNAVVDAEARLRVCGFVDGRCREGVGKVSIARAVENIRVSVKVGPAGASRAERRELEVRLVDTGALEDGVCSTVIRARQVVSATYSQPDIHLLA